MEREAAAAALDALRGEDAAWHDGTFTNWSKTRTNSLGDVTHPYPAGAGEALGVADVDLTPWDKFTTELNASPVPPVSLPGGDGGDTEQASDADR